MRAIEQVRKISLRYAMIFEQYLFNLAGQYCEGYNGGMWTSKQVNDYWIAVPPMKGQIEFGNPENYTEVKVNALTAGAAITVIALNRVLWKAHSHAVSADDHKIVEALSDLWDNTKDAIFNCEDKALDKSAFARIID